MSKQYPAEFRQRAARLVAEQRDQYPGELDRRAADECRWRPRVGQATPTLTLTREPAQSSRP